MLLMSGSWGLGQPNYTSNFLDLQARAMLHGGLEVSARQLGIEAICVDPPTPDGRCPGDRSHVYFGPVPSVLRMPVLAVTDRFDGRLTRPSMLLAVLTLVVATTRLLWAIRRRPDDGGDDPATSRIRRRDLVVMALAPTAVVCGTVVWFLSSQTVVYHEVILWGIALSVLAYDSVIRLAIDPSARLALSATAWSTLALLTRASVGIGPPLALGLLAAYSLVTSLRRRRSDPPPGFWLLVGGGAAFAMAVYMAVNLAKFGTLFSLPLDRQVYSVINPQRRAALADNGGSLFGLKFAPTTLWQYLRPGAVRPTGWFPYVDYGTPAREFGGVTFDTIGRSSSLVTSSPWLILLAIVGAFSLARQRGALLTAIRFPLIGSAVGALTALSIAFVANRYLGDLIPPLVLLGAVGVWSVVDGCNRRRTSVAVATVAALTLGAAGVVNGGLGLVEQRLYSPRTASVLADFVATQDAWPALTDPPVRRRTSFPSTASTNDRPATRLVVGSDGRCAALYVSDGASWTLAELAAPLHRRIVIKVDELSRQATELLPGVTIRRTGRNSTTVRAGGFDAVAAPISGRAVVVDLLADPTRPTLTVEVDGIPRLAVDVEGPPVGDPAIGTARTTATPTLDAQDGCGSG